MFAIGIRYLCGWSMATHPADRQRPEWPPHPDRVFMALAAAHFETDGGTAEYEALRLLSSLEPPSVAASDAYDRQPVTNFVPVNDDASPLGKKGQALMAAGSLPIGRGRQARSFPVAVPERDVVYLLWPDADVSEQSRLALRQLCPKVTAVGHSASLVQMWVEDNPPLPNLEPTDGLSARRRLRVPGPNRLEELQDRYPEVRPNVTGWQGYQEILNPDEEKPAAPGTVFVDELIVLRRKEGEAIGLESTLLLTDALRGAVMRSCPDQPPDWVSGHDGPQGPPSRRPHLAFLPLAHVGREHADGRLLGAALAVPREVGTGEQYRCLARFLFRENEPVEQRLTFGRLGEWTIVFEDREDRPVALRSETWTAAGWAEPSPRWASVTPVVLDRYPKGRDGAERAIQAARTIRIACQRVGLPEPTEVIVTTAPLFTGVPHARSFAPLAQGPNVNRRFHTHALVTFPEPVCGPILIGAGRYRGYGLLRPWREPDR